MHAADLWGRRERLIELALTASKRNHIRQVAERFSVTVFSAVEGYGKIAWRDIEKSSGGIK
jgi:hypothetical protein